MNRLNQDDLTLNSLFEEVSQGKPKNPYEDFSLLSNPFPTSGQFYGICVDQESVKQEFTRKLREFYRNSESQIMKIVGSTGAGKTNLLRFFEQTLQKWRDPPPPKKAITDLFTVFIEQPQGSYLEIHRQIIRQFRVLFFTEFFLKVKRDRINLSGLSSKLPGINPELIQALVSIVQTDSRQLSLQDVAGQTYWLPEPQSYQTLENWLQGVKLTVSEKKQLGNVSVEVGKSATVAIKFLADLVKIFLHVRLFRGIIIFFDEFEEVLSGLSTTSQAQYAQDLRNLFDSHSKGIVFVVATAPISEQLQKISPALQRRLGEGAPITSIPNEDAALEYAQAYIQLGRDIFKEKMKREISLPKDLPNVDLLYYPLTATKVKEVYNGLKNKHGHENVLPGSLLPELNRLFYQRVYEEK